MKLVGWSLRAAAPIAAYSAYLLYQHLNSPTLERTSPALLLWATAQGTTIDMQGKPAKSQDKVNNSHAGYQFIHSCLTLEEGWMIFCVFPLQISWDLWTYLIDRDCKHDRYNRQSKSNVLNYESALLKAGLLIGGWQAMKWNNSRVSNSNFLSARCQWYLLHNKSAL